MSLAQKLRVCPLVVTAPSVHNVGVQADPNFTLLRSQKTRDVFLLNTDLFGSSVATKVTAQATVKAITQEHVLQGGH